MASDKKRKLPPVLDTTQVICETLRSSFNDLLAMKKKGENPENIRKVITKSSVLFSELKQSNRETYFEIDARKNESQADKSKLDEINLQLQELQYERSHLKREIHACKSHKPKYLETSLISEEEFVKSAPSDLSNTTDPHQRMLNRFNFELTERKRLQAQVEELKTRKKALSELNQQKKKFLDGLQSRVSTLGKATVPIQQYISLQVSEQLKNVSTSAYLPSPLYILFYQFSVFKETLDNSMDVSIIGDVNEAKEFSKKVQSPMEISQSKTKDAMDISVNESITQTHPLSVAISFDIEEENKKHKITLKFNYLVKLNIVTVNLSAPTITTEDATPILVNLYPNDTGISSPNPANLKITSKLSFIGNTLGRPFHWAQWIASLKFMDLPSRWETNTNRSNDVPFDVIINQIKTRLKYYMSLQQQLQSLAKLQMPTNVRYVMYPLSPQSMIFVWKEITRSEYESKGGDAIPLDEQSLTSIHAYWWKIQSRYFQCVLKKDAVQLQALIEVPSEYPIRPPIFKLSFLTKFEENSVIISQQIKDKSDPKALQLLAQGSANAMDNNLKNMEVEINAKYDELIANQPQDYVLSLQLQKLRICFDMFIDGVRNQDKIPERVFSGRDRVINYSEK